MYKRNWLARLKARPNTAGKSWGATAAMIEALEQRMLLSSAVGMSAVITSPQTLQSNSSIAPQVAPADAGQLVFTSASKATFAAGTAASFTIATSFSTGIQLFESDLAGTASGLPTGLTFHDNGDGTGTLSGTPAIGTGGTYTLVHCHTMILG
jgi:hypothetical protein